MYLSTSIEGSIHKGAKTQSEILKGYLFAFDPIQNLRRQ